MSKKIVTHKGGKSTEHLVSDEVFDMLNRVTQDAVKAYRADSGKTKATEKGEEAMKKPTYRPHEAIQFLGRTSDARTIFQKAVQVIDKIEEQLRTGDGSSLTKMISDLTGPEPHFIELESRGKTLVVVNSCYEAAIRQSALPDMLRIKDKVHNSDDSVKTLDRTKPSRATLIDLTVQAKDIAYTARERANEAHDVAVDSVFPKEDENV